jgi:hypothetical protein
VLAPVSGAGRFQAGYDDPRTGFPEPILGVLQFQVLVIVAYEDQDGTAFQTFHDSGPFWRLKAVRSAILPSRGRRRIDAIYPGAWRYPLDADMHAIPPVELMRKLPSMRKAEP